MHSNSKILRLIMTARGQLAGITKMIEEDRYCIDVSNQIAATQSILKKVNIEILTNHLTHCVKETFEGGNELDKQNKIKEVSELLNKLMK